MVKKKKVAKKVSRLGVSPKVSSKKSFEDELCDFDKKYSSKCDFGMGYFLGFIGAAVYFIGVSTSFWGGVLGFLKALVWPAFLVYELLKFLVA
jgi:hypothetical protein